MTFKKEFIQESVIFSYTIKEYKLPEYQIKFPWISNLSLRQAIRKVKILSNVLTDLNEMNKLPDRFLRSKILQVLLFAKVSYQQELVAFFLRTLGPIP